MERLKKFIKKETVLTIAICLAIITMFVVPPDKRYVDYIDFRTLGILFCLMAVVGGFRKAGVFEWLARKMINATDNMGQVALVLTLLSFTSSMFITNDVALITFVPFAIIVMKGKASDEVLIKVVVFMTIAANLGSMLTPLGNPQNLYLYGKMGISFGDFVMIMLPYTVASLVLIFVFLFLSTRKTFSVKNEKQDDAHVELKKFSYMLYFVVMLVVSLLTVFRVVDYKITFVIVAACTLVFDKEVVKKVDYSLILTFIAFFVFVGNMARIDWFNDFISNIIEGNEMITTLATSQVISNVPATLLLSGFTDKYNDLLVGANLGGLGTLIASMASLISYKFIAVEKGEIKGKYIKTFTVINVVFLVILYFTTLV